MSVELTLRRTNDSGPLTPARLDAALVRLAGPGAPRGAMRGHVLRIAFALELADDACAAIALRFERQGAEVSGSGRGPSAALLRWSFQWLAAELPCGLGPAEALDRTPPATLCDAALAYLIAYEREVLAERAAPGTADGEPARFLAWLAREEHVLLAENAEALGSLPIADPPALYELLMESPAIDEVFVGETELTALLARWRAFRGGPAAR